jgi:hypothetical protein
MRLWILTFVYMHTVRLDNKDWKFRVIKLQTIDRMRGTWRMQRIFVGKYQRKRTLVRPRRR